MIKEYFSTIHQIITAGHWVTDQVGKELKEFGITEPQYNVLRILDENDGGPVTVQKILGGMVQRSSNVTRIIDKLCAKGLTERMVCPSNRRKMDITITDEGVALLKQLDRKVFGIHKHRINHLNDSELHTLRQLIKRLKLQDNE